MAQNDLPYQIGDVVYINNSAVSSLRTGKKLAEVTGWRLDGSITYMLYRVIESEREDTMPLLFVEALVESAGKEASLIYGPK